MTVIAMCSEVDTMCAELHTQTLIGMIGNRDAMEGINDRRPLVLRIIMAIGKIIWKILKFIGKILTAIPRFIGKLLMRLVMSRTIPNVYAADVEMMNEMMATIDKDIKLCQRARALNYDYDDLLRSITDGKDNEQWVDRALDKLAKLNEDIQPLQRASLHISRLSTSTLTSMTAWTVMLVCVSV